jgi:hypothetical protein
MLSGKSSQCSRHLFPYHFANYHSDSFIAFITIHFETFQLVHEIKPGAYRDARFLFVLFFNVIFI